MATSQVVNGTQTLAQQLAALKETKTPYGTIYRESGREWFAGSETELRAAKNWEFFSNPENADKNSLALEAALAAECDEDEARALPMPEAE